MKQAALEDILVQAGLLNAAGLARALEVQRRDGGSLARIVTNLGLATEEAVARTIAKALGLVYTSLETESLPAEPDHSLPPEFSRKRRILPLGVDGRSIRLAMADPLDQSTIQDVEFRTSRWVVVVVATETKILQVLSRLYPEPGGASLAWGLLTDVAPEGEVEATAEDNDVVDPAELAKDVKQPPIVRLVNMILTDAAKAGASDIHIEPQETCLQVRHRVDGMLQDVLKIPKHLQQSTTSRLKIISGMDIAERRKPQDGRSRLRVGQRQVDLRVSALPTNLGEKIVVRLLENASARIEMTQIGFTPGHLQKVQDLLGRPQGMILVTGPTGSGKTSTLYASLNWSKSPTKNVITVEDPIEYQLPGITQVQINPKAGVTFASGLRSILRQDPNVVLVGEIRDQETAGIALEAAQTGHLLLSTLHTNDAPSSITRLIDLGIEPFLVASSVIGILAQRLVRRLCPNCAVDRAPSAELIEKVGGAARLPENARWMAGRGCDECHRLGYRGRIAIHELLVVTDEVREQISRRAADHQIREAARRGGMRMLMEDGIEKAAQGVTTLEEVVRVAPRDELRQARPAPLETTEPAPQARGAASAASLGAPVFAQGACRATDGRKLRVLVVEDSPTITTVVKYFLELEGFEVLAAEDGLTGLEIARTEALDVVVSDLNMPGMDGITLIKALREDPATRGLPILMLTSESSVESETLGLSSGADDYLTKPVEPRRLAARLRTILARAQPSRMAAS